MNECTECSFNGPYYLRDCPECNDLDVYKYFKSSAEPINQIDKISSQIDENTKLIKKITSQVEEILKQLDFITANLK